MLAVGIIVVTKLPKQRTRRSMQNNTQMYKQYREGDFSYIFRVIRVGTWHHDIVIVTKLPTKS